MKAKPPVAPPRPHTLTAHGDDRVDGWYWLREKDDPEVLAHLEAENEHTRAALAHTEALQQELYDEMLARIQETDLSVPARKGDWWYLSRTVEGQQYAVSCRRRGGPEGPEEVLLDQNVLAEGHDYLSVANLSVSPGTMLMAYAVDFDGSERYTLRVRDLATATDLADQVPDTSYGLAWSADDRWVFYVKVDEAMRPWQLWRHRLGADPAGDTLVHQEDDERFFLSVHDTKTERYVLLVLDSKVTSEVWFLDSTDPEGRFRVIQPRQQGVEYGVTHAGESFLIITNADGAENFKLVSAPVATPDREHWVELIAHREDVKLDGVDVFAGHLVVFERAGGISRLGVRRLADGTAHVIEQPEPVYTAWPDANWEMETTTLRFGYSSLVTPRSVFDYDMEARTRELRKQQPVLGGYDPALYETRRLWATADDGAQVPISMVFRRGLEPDGSAPALLYGYGSYEISIDPTFSSLRLSLLERGFLFAIAHVRGGGEMGRSWYEDGKFLAKPNTFSDFVACARHLVDQGWTSPGRLAIRGGSAGGLLMGAVTNLAPELFAAVVAEVPFVDALTTILDQDLPLTVTEWEEWGNPVADAAVYACMKAYAPYDNVAARPYPAVLATAGLNDPRVGYWEPAKWVQRLREHTTSGRPVLLKTEMGAGHGGPSGRYEAWRDEALVYAFVLDALGLAGA
ncbi:MAG: S9 family peptidase [Acidimicrobiales bacterium]